MKKRKKLGRKLLSFLLTLAMVVGLVPGMGMTAYAAADEVSENISLVNGQSLVLGTHYSVSGEFENEAGIHVYNKGPMTINARKGETITKVVLTYNWGNNKSSLSASAGTFDGNATISDINAQQVTISSSNTAGVKISAVRVYFEGDLNNPTVTLTGGANAKSSGGLLTQSYLPGAMDTVTYTALTGAAFPEFETYTQNGVTVERTSDTVVTISGTPTANTEITVPDAESSGKIVTWNSATISSIRSTITKDYTYTANGITLNKTGKGKFDNNSINGYDSTASFEFTTATGKFTSIEIEASTIYDGGNWTKVGNTLKWNGTPTNSVSLSGSRLYLEGVSSINFVIEMPTVSVTITPGSNMTKTADSGAAEQTGLTGPMTDVVYTADEGYYFPENYSVDAVNGISVTRNSYTQITVSGTPTADASITLTAPMAKTTPAAPTAAAATDCTTADNNDGKLTGVTNAMEYKKSDATEWTAGTGSDITGLVPGTYYVRVKATDTTNASANQELTVKGFISYTVTFKVVNGKWNEGEGDAATADKTVTLTGYEGDTLKLTADQIPTVGTKPNNTYKAGSWDVTPSTDTEITGATTYTYTYAQKDSISQTVTFKVVNGSWNDGTTTDKTVTLTGYEGDTLKLTADQIPTVGTKPNNTYKAGSWDVTPSTDTEITGATTYTYTYAQKDSISQTVTFKVVNGSWNDGTTTDKTVTLTGYEGDTLKLTADQIPTVGTKPNDTYKAGSWDVMPNTDTAITEATTYTYTYAQKDSISQTVTFKVVNGSWDDETTADKTVILTGYEGDTLKLAATDIPAVGTKPNNTYKAGSWDVMPNTDTAITEATTYTYTYVAKEASVVTKAPEAKTLTYNGSAQELVTAGTATGGTMQYALGTATEATQPYTTSIPTGTNAGIYYVWYKVVGDANHNSTEPNSVEAKINPVDKTDLNTAIEEAEAYYNTIKVNSDYSEQKEALGSAISTAKLLAGNDNVTAAEVSERITAVNSAKTTAETAVEGIIESNKEAFAAEKTTQKNNAYSLAKDGDSDASRKLIEDAKKAIDAIDFDNTKTLEDNKAALADIITKLTDNLTTQRAADKLASDKVAFEVEKNTKQKVADALSEELDSDASKKLITDAKAAIEALTYDETKSLDVNKAAIEAVITSLKTDLGTQRAEDLATNKEAFGADKETQKKAADALAADGDSDASKRLIEDAKKAIDEPAYDETKSLDENKAALAAIVSKLKDELTAKRAEEKKEAADKAAADKVIEAINTLPAKEDVTASDKEAVEAARAAYDALTASQKDKIDTATLQKLTDAKAALKAAEKAESDKAAADAVKTRINALKAADKITTTDKAAIEEARKAYDALSADQKKLVDAATLKKLTDAEKALTTAEANDKASKELEAAKQEAQAAMNEQVTVTQKGNKFTVKWTKAPSADGYYVYASYCGKKATKPVKTVKKNTTTKVTISKINGKKISTKKNFHVYVVPYKIIDGKKVALGKSTVVHLVGAKSTKYSNVKKLTLKKTKYTVKVGKTAKIKAKVTLVNNNKKHIPKSHGAKFRYKSSDTSIATVDKNGKVKGIRKGTCTIYVYSINGLMKKAKVTVK